MEQLASAARVAPQAFVPIAIAKSLGLAPPIAMPPMLRVALPEFVSVATSADAVVPTVVLGKASDEVNLAIGAGAGVPVPVSVADWVVGVALSVTVSIAE